MRKARLHILLVVNSLCFGGAEKHAVTLLNTLDTERFHLSLAYLKDDVSLLPQLQIERAPGGVFSCQVTRKIDWPAARRLAAHIQEQDVDIIVCTNTYSLLYAWLAQLCTGRLGKARPRIVEVFHSTMLGTFEDEMQMLFYRPWILACDCLVYVCHNQRRYWRRRALRARGDTVIYNGVDVNYFFDGYSQQEKADRRRLHGFTDSDIVVGLCAAMRPEKQHGDLLQAVARLRNEGVPVTCLLIGDGPQRAVIDDMMAALHLQHCVRVTGFVTDVRPDIAICDVMAITSHCVETFSIAALEAMALAKPMVMTDIGGAREQVTPGTNGYLYPPGDIDALAAILHTLQDPFLRRSMAIQARATVVEHFSLDRMVSAYAQLFDQLVPDSDLQSSAQHVG